MRRATLLAALALAPACSPDIGNDPAPDNLITVEFDPAAAVPVVPSPNDLALQGDRLVVPCAPGKTPENDAECEFNKKYLTGLDGFPMQSTASALTTGPLDTSSVTPTTVRTLDLGLWNGAPSAPAPVADALPVVSAHGVQVPPPPGGWLRSHRYAVVVIGGDVGVKGAQGEKVIGSAAWSLLLQEQSLVGGEGCDVATNPGACVPTTSLIKSNASDPFEQAKERNAKAVQFEKLRLSYKPIIDGLVASGLKRADLASLWTFRITSHAQMTFDPAGSVIPFPNDLLMSADRTHVQIPLPTGASPTLTALIGGLNTLDGFSSTAPMVSESGDGTGALTQGLVDRSAENLAVGDGKNINVFVTPTGPAAAALPAPKVVACVNCTVSPTVGSVTKPELLELVPQVPLFEHTSYTTYITSDFKDTTGTPVIAAPAFALFRLAHSLVDSSGHSTVSLLTDAQAAALEPARLAYKPLFDGLEAKGLPREKIVLASSFTTQTSVSALAQLHAAPAQGNAPTVPLWAGATTLPGGVPQSHIGAAYAGELVDLFALVSASGTFNPGLAGAVPRPLPFLMTVPNTTAPAGGWPVVVFGHGLTGARTNMLGIADSLAQAGFVTIAVDEPWHGERNTCKGFGAYLSAASATPGLSDNLACADPVNQSCNAVGRCQANVRSTTACSFGTPTADATCAAAGEGACAPDSHCENATFATTVSSVPVSGWNLLNLSNLFATRDNFRQQVITFTQVVRAIQDTTSPTRLSVVAGNTPLNPNAIHYAGQSLGGILGSLFTSVAPEINRVLLNVPGANVDQILLTSPAFAANATAFKAALAAQGIPTNSPAYDTFIGWAKWILDPADPANAIYYVTHALPAAGGASTLGASRSLFVQWIEGDAVIPNATTVSLIRSALANPTLTGNRDLGLPVGFFDYQWNSATTPSVSPYTACTRHGFLLAPPSTTVCTSDSSGLPLTGAAQVQAVTFLSGAAPY